MIHCRSDGANVSMGRMTHIAFVIPSADATEWEARLVHSVSHLPDVHASVFLVNAKRTMIDQVERLRTIFERRIARERLGTADFSANDSVTVTTVAAEDVWPLIGASRPDAVMLLTTTVPTPPPSTGAEVFELWLDGRRSEGLGLTSAAGSPAREVVVTRRAASDLGGARVASQRSVLTTTPGLDAADRRNAAARSITLLVRALRNCDEAPQPWHADAEVTGALTRSSRAAAAIATSVGRALLRRASRLFFVPVWWHLAYRTSPEHFVANTPVPTPDGFEEVDCGPDRFWADPLAFTAGGIDVVFFEELILAEGRGVISCTEVGEDGRLAPARRVLERPYHLSYPFVFEHDGAIFMIPETSSNFTVELYRCTSFPDQWIFEATLLSDIFATDATLYHDGTRWWMFLTVGENGSYSWDELHLFMAESPSGPWQPHPGNPVKCDSRSARPAGPLFRREGRLIRPTQDCSQTYGGAIRLCEIEILTPSDFREQVIDQILPDWIPGANGIHTLTATNRVEVIDIRTPRRFRWSPLSPKRG